MPSRPASAPPVVIWLPDPLLRLFPGAEPRVEVAAKTVADALEALEACWPGMRDRLCDSTPAIRRHINIFVDGRRADLDTPLPAGTEMVVLTAISGGL